MADPIPNAERHGDLPELSNDLHALRERTARAPHSLAHHVATIRSRREAQARRSSLVDSMKSRPWLATGVAVVVLAIAMLVVPISYMRTTGERVALRLSGLNASQLAAVAGELKAQLHSDGIAVRATEDRGVPAFEFETVVPSAAGVNVAMVAQAFAKSLNDRGYHASSAITPVRERVSGSVYAYAKDLVIKVSTEGKTSAQIESEIRQRLADAGITDAQVSVTDQGNQREVKLSLERTAGAGKPQPPEHNVSLELTKDGNSMPGPGLKVEVRKTRTPAGVTLYLDVHHAAKSATIEIPNTETMTDAALKSAVESRLRQMGIAARVTVTNGQVGIELP